MLVSCEDENTLNTCKLESDPNAVCIEIYQPVCGCDNQTYSNSCYAESAGITSWTAGECASG